MRLTKKKYNITLVNKFKFEISQIVRIPDHEAKVGILVDSSADSGVIIDELILGDLEKVGQVNKGTLMYSNKL